MQKVKVDKMGVVLEVDAFVVYAQKNHSAVPMIGRIKSIEDNAVTITTTLGSTVIRSHGEVIVYVRGKIVL